MSSPSIASTEVYWTELDISDEDLELILNLLLEREAPLTTLEMAEALVEHRLIKLEEEALRASKDDHEEYKPAEKYEKGQILRFPAMGGALGEVIGIRPGENPDLGSFDVIEIAFQNDDRHLEFAAQLEAHALNEIPEPSEIKSDFENPQYIIEHMGDSINSKLERRLEKTADIVRIAGRWFPKPLLAEVHEGHLNLAEAVLDVSEGGPLPTSALLEHIELPADLDPLLAEFSLDFALQENERFDEVGPAGQVLWFLKRLEPPEVLFTPPRLVAQSYLLDRSKLTDELIELELQLDDELSDLPHRAEEVEDVTFPLLFPHWRVGTLPLSSRLKSLFPTAYEAPRIRFILIDGHSGDSFPGWVVRAERYVFGLEEWYRRYDVPAGGLIRVRRGEKPGEVIVEAAKRRKRNEWVRTVAIHDGDRAGFTMLKQPLGTAYDELMVVGLVDATVLDEVWLRGSQRQLPLDRLVAYVFRELAKLNPQTAVHAQALYSGINVFRRVPPGPLFTELVTQPYYQHVGDLYWRFDESSWRQE
ncbi:MAG: hypothetical protein PVI78_11370 [Anaerolineales bacterium]|jgi:hypothetical protein